MKLPRGNLKVIIIDPKATAENDERHRNRGKIFVPPFRVYERDEGADLTLLHTAFGVRGRGLKTRVSFDSFPYAWANRDVAKTRAWFETTDELTIAEDLHETLDAQFNT